MPGSKGANRENPRGGDSGFPPSYTSRNTTGGTYTISPERRTRPSWGGGGGAADIERNSTSIVTNAGESPLDIIASPTTSLLSTFYLLPSTYAHLCLRDYVPLINEKSKIRGGGGGPTRCTVKRSQGKKTLAKYFTFHHSIQSNDGGKDKTKYRIFVISVRVYPSTHPDLALSPFFSSIALPVLSSLFPRESLLLFLGEE